jgi:hypothetical protein
MRILGRTFSLRSCPCVRGLSLAGIEFQYTESAAEAWLVSLVNDWRRAAAAQPRHNPEMH